MSLRQRHFPARFIAPVLLAFPLMLTPRPLAGPEPEIGAWFTRLAENRVFSGAVLVARGDSIVFRGAFGRADWSLDVANRPDTRFAIGSLTKTFTAAAIVMLADRGRLSLDDPLARFVPGFPQGDSITLRHLLLHRSGLANPDYVAGFTEHLDLPSLVERIGSRPPLFPPGARGAYSNAGYNVLARIVEVASGVPYHEFLQREIFTPLGMAHTGPLRVLSVTPGLATGYIPGPAPSGVAPAPLPSPTFSTGAGDLVSTVDDLRQWARAVRENRFFDRTRLEYPYGWGRLGEDRQAGIEQTGLANGFTASLSIWFADSLDVVILGNIESAEWSGWPERAAALARGADVPLPAVRPLRAGRPAPHLTGAYANEAHVIEVREHGGGLWLYLDDWPVPKHLDPTDEPSLFTMRAETGAIRFAGERGAPAARLVWRFPSGDSTEYVRRDRGAS